VLKVDGVLRRLVAPSGIFAATCQALICLSHLTCRNYHAAADCKSAELRAFGKTKGVWHYNEKVVMSLVCGAHAPVL
jgi:hypothetical protein